MGVEMVQWEELITKEDVPRWMNGLVEEWYSGWVAGCWLDEFIEQKMEDE